MIIPKLKGFTLIETLVALAILAVALGAAYRSVSFATDSADTMRERMLARWIAQNRLVEKQVAPTLPPLGRREGTAQQAGQEYVWRETVTTTPNPAFRKIEISVAHYAKPEYELARIVGYLVAGAGQ